MKEKIYEYIYISYEHQTLSRFDVYSSYYFSLYRNPFLENPFLDSIETGYKYLTLSKSSMCLLLGDTVEI
jgi:hypothetical protein